jgi:YD repeat-containing protein
VYVYDELGRLVAEIDPAGETTQYSYDAAGNLLSVSRGSSSQFRVVSFAPSRGVAGDTVSIFGSGFVANPAQNSVSFNGTPATITSATTTTLVVTVPAGATSGPLSVSNANGGVTTAQAFTVLQPATITAVTPASVNRGATTRLQVSGSQLATARAVNFTQGGLTVRIVPVPTDQAVTFDLTVAPNTPVGAYPFSITTDAGTSNSGSVVVNVTTSLLGDVLAPTKAVSVHLPDLTQGAPAGNRLAVWPRSVSVYVPATIPGAPAGNALSAWPAAVSVYLPATIAGESANALSAWPAAVSVHLPATIGGAPAGDAMTVTQPASVSMP